MIGIEYVVKINIKHAGGAGIWTCTRLFNTMLDSNAKKKALTFWKQATKVRKTKKEKAFVAKHFGYDGTIHNIQGVYCIETIETTIIDAFGHDHSKDNK